MQIVTRGQNAKLKNFRTYVCSEFTGKGRACLRGLIGGTGDFLDMKEHQIGGIGNFLDIKEHLLITFWT